MLSGANHRAQIQQVCSSLNVCRASWSGLSPPGRQQTPTMCDHRFLHSAAWCEEGKDDPPSRPRVWLAAAAAPQHANAYSTLTPIAHMEVHRWRDLEYQLLIGTDKDNRDNKRTESVLRSSIGAPEPFPPVMSLFSLSTLTRSGFPSNFRFDPTSLFRNPFVETPRLFIIKMWLLSRYDRVSHQNVCTCVICSFILDSWLSYSPKC